MAKKKIEVKNEQMFIPGTKERHVTPDIVFRPIRSWHCNTYAGEGLFNNHGDGSGCLIKDKEKDLFKICHQPKAVTHRIYWHKNHPGEHISSFLSYPDGMGAVPSYFWEIYPVESEEGYSDIERFYGDNAEQEMEKRVIELLMNKLKEKFLKEIGHGNK